MTRYEALGYQPPESKRFTIKRDGRKWSVCDGERVMYTYAMRREALKQARRYNREEDNRNESTV